MKRCAVTSCFGAMGVAGSGAGCAHSRGAAHAKKNAAAIAFFPTGRENTDPQRTMRGFRFADVILSKAKDLL
jgi:hypothetical protein